AIFRFVAASTGAAANMPATDAVSSTLVIQVLRIISPTCSHDEATRNMVAENRPVCIADSKFTHMTTHSGVLPQSPCGRYWGFSRRQGQRGLVQHLLQRKAGADLLNARNGCELLENEALER